MIVLLSSLLCRDEISKKVRKYEKKAKDAVKLLNQPSSTAAAVGPASAPFVNNNAVVASSSENDGSGGQLGSTASSSTSSWLYRVQEET